MGFVVQLREPDPSSAEVKQRHRVRDHTMLSVRGKNTGLDMMLEESADPVPNTLSKSKGSLRYRVRTSTLSNGNVVSRSPLSLSKGSGRDCQAAKNPSTANVTFMPCSKDEPDEAT